MQVEQRINLEIKQHWNYMIQVENFQITLEPF